MKSLNRAISARCTTQSPYPRYSEQATEVLEQSSFKARALVREDLKRASVAKDPRIQEHPGDGTGFLISDGYRFRISTEMIYYRDDVFIFSG